MKKKLVSIIIGATFFLTLATPALAHGHNGTHHDYYGATSNSGSAAQTASPSSSNNTTKPTKKICDIDGCTKTYDHRHSGVWYYGHNNEDGHDHNFTVCNVEGCSRTYNHSHNGTGYYGHHSEDGHYSHTNGYHH